MAEKERKPIKQWQTLNQQNHQKLLLFNILTGNCKNSYSNCIFRGNKTLCLFILLFLFFRQITFSSVRFILWHAHTRRRYTRIRTHTLAIVLNTIPLISSLFMCACVSFCVFIHIHTHTFTSFPDGVNLFT